ncbi:MAG: short-chain dehydrogenase [Microbacteriaceae bacterium]|nr:short-chain dehydrogenase [Microbacteriaceae bacterium]
MSKKNIVVVITGASSGVGRATALRFARGGAKLVLAARRGAALRDVVAECEELGASAIPVMTDVTDAAAVEAVAVVAVANFGAIDVWVNCAAVGVYADFSTVPLADFRRVLDVNIMGYVHGARSALEVMTQQGYGTIVNVSSIVGEVTQPYASSYGMSKAAVRALGSTLRQELGLQKQKHIHVVTILPPTLDTPFFGHAANYTGRALRAMPPVFTPDQVAKKIVASVKHPKGEIVVGAAGKALVRQHRTHPVSAEGQMAVLVENGQFKRREGADPTAGNLYSPSPASDAAVTGGWHGEGRSASRKVLLWLLLAGAGTLVALYVLGGDGGSSGKHGGSRDAQTKKAVAALVAAKVAKSRKGRLVKQHGGPDDAATVMKKTQRNLHAINRSLKKQAKANR